jgi:hypothetical protein
MRKVFFGAMIFFSSVPFLAAQQMKSGATIEKPAPKVINATITYVQAPVLISPKSETLDLSGQEKLEFRWETNKSPYEVFCYLFRIYQGQDMTQKNEVYSEQVSGLDTSIEVPTDYFKDGETYTWYIKQINNAPPLLFSDPVFWTFKIIKKEKGSH